MMQDFIRQLKLLPYNDMKTVARELALKLPAPAQGKINETQLADALGALSELKLKDSPDTTKEAQFMHEIFTRRRSISIKWDGTGYQMQLETLNVNILHTDLKIGLNQLLDTVVTAHALRK